MLASRPIAQTIVPIAAISPANTINIPKSTINIPKGTPRSVYAQLTVRRKSANKERRITHHVGCVLRLT